MVFQDAENLVFTQDSSEPSNPMLRQILYIQEVISSLLSSKQAAFLLFLILQIRKWRGDKMLSTLSTEPRAQTLIHFAVGLLHKANHTRPVQRVTALSLLIQVLEWVIACWQRIRELEKLTV